MKREVEIVREEMAKAAKEFEDYKLIVGEEVKVNEMLRYKQRKLIYKLRDDIEELKNIMMVPRLHSKYVEENKDYVPKHNDPHYLQ